MSNRNERASSEVMRALAVILDTKLHDPRLSERFLTITEVRLASNFQFCRILLGIMSESPDDAETVLKLLRKSEGYIKSELAKMVKMPLAPSLVFEIDKGVASSSRVNEILKNLNIPKADEE